ncbi:hypothetical protein C7C46_15035, partial [Streptomyces tateyamensis]
EWLARGVSPAGLRHALAAGLPQPVKCAAALLRHRLVEKMPPERVTAEPTTCAECERPFRSASGEHRCRSCREPVVAATELPPPDRIGWRERVRQAATA